MRARKCTGWEFQIKGVIREDDPESLGLLEKLERDLQASVFQIAVTNSTHQQQFRGDEENGGTPSFRGPGRLLERSFFVSGVIP